MEEDGEAVIEIIKPLPFSTEPRGVLRPVCTLKLPDREIGRSRKQIRDEIKGPVYRSVAMSRPFYISR